MKLVSFLQKNSSMEEFGFILKEKVISFEVASQKAENDKWIYNDVKSYLNNLPLSENSAHNIHDYTLSHFADFKENDLHDINEIKLMPPVRPPALLDFGLTPRHLKNAAMTLLRHEYSPIFQKLLGLFVKRKIDKMSKSETLSYYKCNHLEIIGDQDFIGWPRYTSYLDIEPELGIVVGNDSQAIAGYVIFNDASARDVQFPEMLGTGPARSKDFSKSNGIGPWLVTTDEILDPLNLEVDITIGTRLKWHGSTSEYTHTPQEVIEYIKSVFTPVPGTIIGMGTVPDCTGLDNDQWLCPGDNINISFQNLGTLRQRIPDNITITRSRWKNRQELQGFYTSGNTTHGNSSQECSRITKNL